MHLIFTFFSLCTAALGLPDPSSFSKGLVTRAATAADIINAFSGSNQITAQLAALQEDATDLNLVTGGLSIAGPLEELVDGIESVTEDIEALLQNLPPVTTELATTDADSISLVVAQFSVVNSRLLNTLIRKTGASCVVPIGATNLRGVFQAYSDAIAPLLYELALRLPSEQRGIVNLQAVQVEQLVGSVIEGYGGILEDL